MLILYQVLKFYPVLEAGRKLYGVDLHELQ